MPTRFYRECPKCRHVEIAEERGAFQPTCPRCDHSIGLSHTRPFIEPKSFVTSVAKPDGVDPGLTRLRPPPAQEARLLSSAEENAFTETRTDVDDTSWAYQDAKHGRMFVVNRGRGFGFLRCSCGFTVVLRDPIKHWNQITQKGHRTPYDQPCSLNSFTTEDLAHEFRTDVLQIRIDQPVLIPAGLSDEERDNWLLAIERTLAEAIRLSAARLLGIDQREISSTLRVRPFGLPEVILYDAVPGGAGYCQTLMKRRSMRELLAAACDILDCPAQCSHSCRACLQDYDNQIHWDKLTRKPVLAWLKKRLADTRH
jgi:hypothetical protein